MTVFETLHLFTGELNAERLVKVSGNLYYNLLRNDSECPTIRRYFKKITFETIDAGRVSRRRMR